MLKTTTTDLDAEAWADAQVRRHTSWADTILGTGPHCTGMCRQGRALCVHPVECGVQRPVLLDDAQLAPAEELQAEPFKRAPTDQDIGEAVGTVVGFVLLFLLFMGGLWLLLSPQGRAFFTWAGKTLAAIF